MGDDFSPPSCPKTVTVRRNPHRKARPPPSTKKPSKSKPQQIPSFPLQEILSIDVNQAQKNLVAENLRVYLRIRPLLQKKSPKRVNKNAWPKLKSNIVREKHANKKCHEVCVSVNDVHSVTLSPPLALQDFKRIKSEVFEGFSYVFGENSSQSEVYENMVKPLVDDFVNGKSGMVAALGPSGSGKTHTVFGTNRDPGMISLALQDIFSRSHHCDLNLSRSFYVSVFEISSERSKVERLTDLSPDGADLLMQQSTIKGLKEVAVSSAAQAESLIAHAMLKRSTAMTNSNSQSSRSQCIINIHYHASKFDDELDTQPINSMLTIVDLAGAEREKRTGNQGSRLLESNFINNTSMVFGQCLRSLLEHQKNPKRPLQKHFQNSLLTRYLRDYLEGKKRMTLILTVKQGEEDYLDTTYLLRQASPYMKIKFKNVEEPVSSVCNKRHNQKFSRAERPKRVKYDDHDADAIEEEKFVEDGQSFLEENRTKDSSRRGNSQAVRPDCINSGRERSHLIMQNFAKALWKVLKQYNDKLMVAETEIQSLTKDLRTEKTMNLELEKKLEEFKSSCSCSKENLESVESRDADIKLDCLTELEGNKCCTVDEVPNYKVSECGNATESCNVRPCHDEAMEEHICSTNPEADCRNFPEFESDSGKNEDIHHQIDENSCFTNSNTSKCSVTAVDNKEDFCEGKIEAETLVDANSNHSTNPKNDEYSYSTNFDTSKCSVTAVDDTENICQGKVEAETSVGAETKFEGPANLDSDESCTVYESNETIQSPKLEPSECSIATKCMSTSGRDEDVYHQKDMVACSLNSEAFDGSESKIKDQDICPQEPLAAAATSQEDLLAAAATSQENVVETIQSSKLKPSECSILTKCMSTSGRDEDVCHQKDMVACSLNYEAFDGSEIKIEDQDICPQEPLAATATSQEDLLAAAAATSQENAVETIQSSKLKPSECSIPAKCMSTSGRDEDVCHQEPLAAAATSQEDPLVAAAISQENVKENVIAESHNIDAPKKTDSTKVLKEGKPKRRLLPASSLLRDISAFGTGNETEKPNGNRGGKNLVGDARTRTQGSLSLLRLLQRNVRI